MIRKAKRTDFEDIFPILNQVFEEMDLATIKRLPISQFYDLMRLGFLSQYYRYSYQRIWVAVDRADRAVGLIDMYSYEDQKVIDFALKRSMPRLVLILTPKYLPMMKPCPVNGILIRWRLRRAIGVSTLPVIYLIMVLRLQRAEAFTESA